jgi:hypothetical protein
MYYRSVQTISAKPLPVIKMQEYMHLCIERWASLSVPKKIPELLSVELGSASKATNGAVVHVCRMGYCSFGIGSHGDKHWNPPGLPAQ